MKISLIGGNFGSSPKRSSVVDKMFDAFNSDKSDIVTMLNGGNLEGSFEMSLDLASSGDLIIWMPNILNEETKHYPTKKPGAVLICSKVMREGYRRVDAISRIFKMHGNAVIVIYKEESLFRFELIDALGNIWFSGSDISNLVNAIKDFTKFTNKAIRVRTSKRENSYSLDPYKDQLESLIDANKSLQDHMMQSCGNRFFGNISTRCSKLFPSMRVDETCMFVSPRNVDKASITYDMMVPYFSDDSYCGERKPSVDSPSQVRIYENLPNINFMIHGHAVINCEDAKWTNEYCLCGDIKEVDEVLSVVDKDSENFIVNLKNHGFLIGAKDIESLTMIIEHIKKDGDMKITNQD